MQSQSTDPRRGRDDTPSPTATALIAALVIAGAAGSAIMAYLVQG